MIIIVLTMDRHQMPIPEDQPLVVDKPRDSSLSIVYYNMPLTFHLLNNVDHNGQSNQGQVLANHMIHD